MTYSQAIKRCLNDVKENDNEVSGTSLKFIDLTPLKVDLVFNSKFNIKN